MRERIEDIPLLLEYFIGRMNVELDRHVRDVAPEAMRLLRGALLAGQRPRVAECRAIRLGAHRRPTRLTPDSLPRHLQQQSAPVEVAAAEQSVDLALARLVQEALADKGPRKTPDQTFGNIYYQVQAVVDRVVLREVLQHVKGNQVEAADLLGISRTTLRSKLRSLGLVVEKQVGDI